MPQKVAHGAPWRFDRRLIGAVGCEPGAMRAGDPTLAASDGSDHRRPGLGRRMLVASLVAAWVEPQRSGFVLSRNAASPYIRLHANAGKRLRLGGKACGHLQATGW